MKYREGKKLPTLDTDEIKQLQNGKVRREGGIETIVDNERARIAENETRDLTEGVSGESSSSLLLSNHSRHVELVISKTLKERDDSMNAVSILMKTPKHENSTN